MTRAHRSPLQSITGLLIILTLALVACGGNDANDQPDADGTAEAKPEDVHLLMLHSYHPEFYWNQQLNHAVRSVFEAQGYSEETGSLVFDTFYMDTKRNTSDAYFEQIAVDAQNYIAETAPDIVIASDDNAVRLVVANSADDGVPFVFLGLNSEPETYDVHQKPNVAGVLERIHINEMLRWIQNILPDAKRVTCLIDASHTSTQYRATIESAIENSVFAGSPLYSTNSFAEWQQYVREAGEDSAFLIIGTYQTVVDEDGNSIPQEDVMTWTIENSAIPVVSFWEYAVLDGALGGPVISGDVQGEEAAQKAIRILNGESPAQVGIDAPVRGKLTLNTETMVRWEIVIPYAVLDNATTYDGSGELIPGDE